MNSPRRLLHAMLWSAERRWTIAEFLEIQWFAVEMETRSLFDNVLFSVIDSIGVYNLMAMANVDAWLIQIDDLCNLMRLLLLLLVMTVSDCRRCDRLLASIWSFIDRSLMIDRQTGHRSFVADVRNGQRGLCRCCCTAHCVPWCRRCVHHQRMQSHQISCYASSAGQYLRANILFYFTKNMNFTESTVPEQNHLDFAAGLE